MKVLVIGSGGREHALAHKVSQSVHVEEVFVIPGNDAMTNVATVVTAIAETDHEKIADFAVAEAIDWVIIGPEQPLTAGLADVLKERGIKVFGPNKKAAQMEGSKSFAKQMMKHYNIPTAAYEMISTKEAALAYIQEHSGPVVLKQDGLAAGKGVIVAMTEQEAVAAVHEFYKDGDTEVVFEEYLQGEEFSLMVFVNDDFIIPLDCVAQDHKRAFDGDTGPNTGGMGAYCPVAHIKEQTMKETNERISYPIARAMKEEGLHYFGLLYIGAIITEEGPKVIEFNARFGDPECQVLLTRLETDLMDIIFALEAKQDITLTWSADTVVGVVLAAKGYPAAYDKGIKVEGYNGELDYYVSGLKYEDGWKTAGGRVMLAVGSGGTVKDAVEASYQNAAKIKAMDSSIEQTLRIVR